MLDLHFNSKDEEIDFWKNKAENYQAELQSTQEELQLYELGSKELEHELELQLNDFENRNKNLLINNDILTLELDTLKNKYKESNITYNKQVSDLQDELSRLRGDKATLQKYVRELEQTNDDLERAYRATVTSLQDFEEQLNIAIEKNAILENELEETESMRETVQRLKDEARDLRQDLEVKEVNIQNSRKSQPDEALVTSMIEEHDETPMITRFCQCTQTDSGGSGAGVASVGGEDAEDGGCGSRSSSNNSNWQARQSALLRLSQQHQARSHNGSVSSPACYTPLTPAARLSALNLVSDMLRKVGAIEHKLTSASQRGFLDSSGSGHNGRATEHMNGGGSHQAEHQAPSGSGLGQSCTSSPFPGNSNVPTPIGSASASPRKSTYNGFDMNPIAMSTPLKVVQ